LEKLENKNTETPTQQDKVHGKKEKSAEILRNNPFE
jgi:hypothetical protein